MTTTTLPETTTERLRAVADIIENDPDSWQQGIWFRGPASETLAPFEAAGAGHECGSAGCVAGWAVALTPANQVMDVGHHWEWGAAGAAALGLAGDLASRLFDEDLRASLRSAGFEYIEHPAVVADMLRRLSLMSEGERTMAAARRVLTPAQFAALAAW